VAAPGLLPSPARSGRKGAVQLGALGIACFLLLWSRSPDILLKPEFWAEDGKIFYQQAHEIGFWHSLFLPYAGYLHLFPRLIAGFAQLVPLAYAPLFFNTAALLVQVVPPLFLCSARMQKLGALPLRASLAFLYIGLPHAEEVWGNLCNSQWHLALLSFLVLIASPPQGRGGMWFDRIVLVIGVLTGPFSILLLPVAGLIVMKQRSQRTLTQLAIVSGGALVQAASLLFNGRPDIGGPLAASFPLFCKLLIFRILFPIFPGATRVSDCQPLAAHPWPLLGSILVVMLLVAALVIRRAQLELQCAILFGAVVLAASLASPLAVYGSEQWPSLMLPRIGERYWFIPRLAIMATVLWLAVQPISKWARAAGIAALIAVVGSCVWHWHVGRMPSLHFPTYAHVFDALPAGTQIHIPINPPGWIMALTKKRSDRIVHQPGFSDGETMALDTWRERFLGAAPEGSPLPLTGAVMTVNGAPGSDAGSWSHPAQVAAQDGVLLEGWALEGDEEDLRPVDRVFAIVAGSVVKGAALPIPGMYRKRGEKNALYILFLPSRVLHSGRQAITIAGYSSRDQKMHAYPQVFYIEGN